MIYDIELEKSLADRVNKFGGPELIVKAVEWYVGRMEMGTLSEEDRIRINPRMCSVLDNDVIRLEIPDDVWVRLKEFADRNRIRIHNVIKEAIREYLYEHY